MKFFNISGKVFNMSHANTIDSYREVHTVIDEEPSAAANYLKDTEHCDPRIL